MPLSGLGPRRPLYWATSAETYGILCSGQPPPLAHSLPLAPPPGSPGNFRRQPLSVGPAGRRERLCTGVMGEGFGPVSVKNNLWRPPVLRCLHLISARSSRVN